MGNSEPTVPPPPPDPRMTQIYNTHNNLTHIQQVRQRAPEVNTTEISRLKLSAFIDRSKVRIVQKQDKLFELWVWVKSETWSQLEVRFYCQSGARLESIFPINGFSSRIAPNQGLEVMIDMDLRTLHFDEIFTATLHHVGIDCFALPDGVNPGPIQRSLFQLFRKENQYGIKLRKQEIVVAGASTVLLDFYGIGGEGENLCLICLSEPKDTIILPCRHVCLCTYCSESLAAQSRKICPVCRSHISEFVRIKDN